MWAQHAKAFGEELLVLGNRTGAIPSLASTICQVAPGGQGLGMLGA